MSKKQTAEAAANAQRQSKAEHWGMRVVPSTGSAQRGLCGKWSFCNDAKEWIVGSKEQRPELDGLPPVEEVAGGQRKEEERGREKTGELGSNTRKPYTVGAWCSPQ